MLWGSNRHLYGVKNSTLFLGGISNPGISAAGAAIEVGEGRERGGGLLQNFVLRFGENRADRVRPNISFFYFNAITQPSHKNLSFIKQPSNKEVLDIQYVMLIGLLSD
jgi:hypothetical protein